MEGPPRANAAQLAARKIKDRPKGRRGGTPSTPSSLSSAPQWAPVQPQGPAQFGGAAAGGGLFGGSVQATGTFDFAAPSGPSFPPPSFGSTTNNIFGMSNGASNQEPDRPVEDRPTKKQFGTSTNSARQPNTFQTPNLFAQGQQTNIFGSANQSQVGNNPFSFGNTSQPATNSASFPPTSTTQSQPSNSIFSFGGSSSAPAPTSISFDSGTTSEKPAFNIFNSGQPTAQPVPSTSAFSFGSSTSQNKPSSTPFQFGQTSNQSTSSSTNAISAPAIAAPSSSIFGNLQPQPPSQPTNIFGKPSSDSGTPNIFANLKPTTPSSTPLFGNGTQEPAKATTSLFGAQAQSVSQPGQESAKATTNLFGSQAQPASQPVVNIFAKPTPPPAQLPSFTGQGSEASESKLETTKSQTPSTGGLFGNSTLQQPQSGNLFGSSGLSAKSAGDPLGTLNQPFQQPFGQPTMPEVNGATSNSAENTATMNSNSPFSTGVAPVTLSNAAAASKPQLTSTFTSQPSSSESATSTSSSLWEKAPSAALVPHTPEVSSLLNRVEASETGIVERDADAPEEPARPPSFVQKVAENTLADLDGDLDDFARLFPGMVYASKFPIQKMAPEVPPEFTPEQRVEFYSACRMKALNKALQRYLNNIQLTDNIFPAMRFYELLRQSILSRSDEELAEELQNLKRKATDRANEENEQPSKRTKQAESSTALYPQLPRDNAMSFTAPSPPKSLQPPSNETAASSTPSMGVFQASPTPPTPDTAPSRGKRKGEELTKDSYENESSSPLKRSKTQTSNGAEAGSNTSNIFKKLLDSPAKPSPGRRSPEKMSRSSGDEKPRFNPFGSLPVPASPAAKTPATAPSSTSLFAPKGPFATNESAPPKSSPATAAVPSKSALQMPAAIKPPTFGTGPVDFLAQFNQQASKHQKDSENDLMEKAKAEDLDSDDDEEEWEANYKKKRAEELKAVEELAKSKRATFVPGKGFMFAPVEQAPASSSTDAAKPSEKSPEKAADNTQPKPLFGQNSSIGSASGIFGSLNGSKASTSGKGSVLDSHKPGQAVAFGANIFAHLSDADSGSDSKKVDDADDESADEETDNESDSENKDPTYNPGAESKSGPGTPVEETGPGIASAKKGTIPSTFGSRQGGLFGTPSISGTSSPGGSLFDRISKDSNGNPIREISSEEKENTKPNTTNIFGEMKNPFASLNKPAGTPADQTWKPDSPIRFGSTTPTNDAKSSGPTVNVQAATPTKPSSPFGNLFGTPKDVPTVSNGSATSPAPFSNLFGNTNNTKPAPTAGVGFNFGASSTSSSLLPSAAVSASTSRATTPGGTTDGDSAAEGDPDAEYHEQIDLTAGGPGEENEDVLHEVRAKALKFVTPGDGTKGAWETKGVGPLRVLRNKDTKAVRILLRAEPRGTVALNKALLSKVKYEATQKTVRISAISDNGKSMETWVLQVKTPEIAQGLAEVMESNKPS
ncbi:uncharacterized protein BP5553_03525 [Venustampulla echinocandica]|uniref:RanBD1 domain-containing protein n=1 Tax=Venustampulla echinocandica TaxID=2656787 RepID=A0A370TUH3_9HELO|nr:uncharacterized protein BP5553_03525 [Venustampulla echinocandica]RDL39185.1 hypothetical protein BP5553_03525 [Venustampulla echinocandica]